MIQLLKEVDFSQTRANARAVLKNFRRLDRIAGRSLVDVRSPIITDMPKGIISRQILHYSFCVQDHYSNYKIAREVGYSERSIQRMKSEALIEFAEAYRNGKIIAYK
ncbi:ArpU family phage packaging/lysis transcriptional regulator [Enterococcus faecalis]|uniref:ArpU family phage packaging/lysis transcriptional regulator n=1 Tax=Enterococcus faecalis TaxID=1351 RepID=UPI0022E81D54|nr:ArpU family phage packaging/lysis transcriptional regulator [Enterococcus faecalis]